jgi:hypothetical protein
MLGRSLTVRHDRGQNVHRYSRVVVKLSGEALASPAGWGVDPASLAQLADELPYDEGKSEPPRSVSPHEKTAPPLCISDHHAGCTRHWPTCV